MNINDFMKQTKGLFIVVEGIDGAGKSTLVTQLVSHLQSQHYDARSTKEPGNSWLGKCVRQILLERPHPLCNKAEYLLFAADRAQHMEEVVIPALQQNAIIISDRGADSSLVYQGYAGHLNIELIDTINRWAMNNRLPDLTFYVHIDIDTALERLKQRNALTHFEKETSFIQSTIEGFNRLYHNRQDVVTIDGRQTIEDIIQQALSALHAIL
jgi:dTMP kinase